MDRDAAHSEFVAARRTHLRRIAYAVCGDWHQVDDLVQTALVKLYVALAASPARRTRGGLRPHDHRPGPHRRDAAAMQRKAVLLRHWLGLSVAETASDLGISEGTVKSHTSRGLAALQQVLTRA